MRNAEAVCTQCKHYHADDKNGFTCDAFPDGIPDPIIEALHDHQIPYPGDHGIQFEPINRSNREDKKGPRVK